jgi:hypothetical protein
MLFSFKLNFYGDNWNLLIWQQFWLLLKDLGKNSPQSSGHPAPAAQTECQNNNLQSVEQKLK